VNIEIRSLTTLEGSTAQPIHVGDLKGAQELTTTDRGHGREEDRTYLQLPAPEDLPGKSQWKALKSVGVVTSRRVEGGAREYRDPL
jgi:hypothetical protein